MLSTDQVGIGIAPLIVMGCIIMRKCHLNTCIVGVAMQDPALHKKFNISALAAVGSVCLQESLRCGIQEHLGPWAMHRGLVCTRDPVAYVA